MLCHIVSLSQAAGMATTKEAYKRGSLYLEKLGVKPASLATKMKASLKSKSESSGKKFDVIKLAEVATIKPFLPQVAGCTIQLLPARKAYTVFYPGVMPASRSRTWGTQCSRTTLSKAVLSWAWCQHFSCTGNACPYDFDAVIL